MSDPTGSRLAVFCRACGYASSAYVAGKIIREGDEEDGPYELSLIECRFCSAPSLVRLPQSRCGPPSSELSTTKSHAESGIVWPRPGNVSMLVRSWQQL